MTPVSVKQLSLLILGLDEDKTHSEDDIKKAYRKQGLLFHPDHGGSTETFRALTIAKDFILETMSKPVFISTTPTRPAYNPPPPPRDDFAQRQRENQERWERQQREERARRDQQRRQNFSEDIPW